MKKALKMNAVFSGISGIFLALFPKPVALFFGLPSGTAFMVVGLALVFFALSILYEIRRQNPLAILWIILQDGLWVIGSMYLLLMNPFDFSPQGNWVVAGVAMVVFLMAFSQAAALAKVDETKTGGIKLLEATRTVEASKAESWKVISDVGNYHRFAPNIDEVRILSGQGQGMIRSCSHGKASWTETCSLWQEEEIYSFVVNTSAPDYPFPFKILKGTWQVVEVDTFKTTIHLRFEFAYNYKIFNLLLHPFLRSRFKKIAEELLDNWQLMLEKKEKVSSGKLPVPTTK